MSCIQVKQRNKQKGFYKPVHCTLVKRNSLSAYGTQ